MSAPTQQGSPIALENALDFANSWDRIASADLEAAANELRQLQADARRWRFARDGRAAMFGVSADAYTRTIDAAEAGR